MPLMPFHCRMLAPAPPAVPVPGTLSTSHQSPAVRRRSRRAASLGKAPRSPALAPSNGEAKQRSSGARQKPVGGGLQAEQEQGASSFAQQQVCSATCLPYQRSRGPQPTGQHTTRLPSPHLQAVGHRSNVDGVAAAPRHLQLSSGAEWRAPSRQWQRRRQRWRRRPSASFAQPPAAPQQQPRLPADGAVAAHEGHRRVAAASEGDGAAAARPCKLHGCCWCSVQGG